MKSFCIASPHKNELWYDYRLYVNLREELEALGFRYQAASQNRIYFLGAPQRHFYEEVGKFDSNANNIALIYCHSEKLEGISQFDKVFVCSEGVKAYLTRKKLARFEFLHRDKKFSSHRSIEIIRPFSSLKPTSQTKPKYRCDVSFIGTPRIRPIVEDVLPIVKKMGLKFNLYGPNWDKYEGNQDAASHWVARQVPYEEFPMLARGSKICLVDHHQSMNDIGSVSHKYVDMVMSGGLVICDNNRDASEYYAGLCYSDPSSLAALLETYLNDEDKRHQKMCEQQLKVVDLTTRAAAVRLAASFV